jgi:metal-sulfur cluster biosynthetic enzyme
MTEKTPITPVPKAERTQPHWKALNEVIDPELNIGVVDLGLIYDVQLDKEKNATIFMTLTSPSCPVGPVIIQQVQDTLRTFPEIGEIETRVVWSPVWTQEMIDPDIKELMFGF